MSEKEKYKRYGYEDAYDTEKENNWTNRLNLDDCIEIMNNQYNEIVELKQQLAEKDKRIAELEDKLKRTEKAMHEEVKEHLEYYNADQKQLRKQVCDKIRHSFYVGKDSYCDKEGKEIITYHINNFILDQIEKGE